MARIRIVVGSASYYADALHASGFTISLNSFAPDTLQFSIPRAIDAVKLFADGAPIEIYQDSTRIFYGSVRATPVAGSPQSERHIVNASGGWWWLEQITFEQAASRYISGVKTPVAISSVQLGRSALADELMTCGEVIGEAVAFADAKGALLASGIITGGPDFPEEEGLDLTCAEVVFRVCRWMPDMVSGFNHSSGLLNVTSTPVSTLTFDLKSSTYRVQLVDPAPRTDLIVPGVRIDYQITSTIMGKTVLSLVRETAGNPDAIGGIKHTMSIRGSSISRMQQTQHIKVAALPAQGDMAWWLSHCADLADARIQNLVLTNPAVDVQAGPNELLEGSIQEWMLDDVPGANYSLHAAESTFTVLATYDLTINGKLVHVEAQKCACKITTTDATTRSYTRLTDSVSGGEYYPSGLAASLYAAGSKTWWDGQIDIVGPEIQAAVIPGMALNISNGRAEWATMAARVVSVQHDLDAGKTSIRVGPPRQMTLGDLADQLRRNRRRRVPTSTGSRLNPDLDDANVIPRIDLGSHPPRKGAVSGQGLLGEESYLVTDARIDPTTDKLQLVRRKGYVVWSESAPAWTDVSGWDVTNCDE